MDSPFGLYAGYIDLVRPMELHNEKADLLGRIAMLEAELLQIKHDFD